eukprot:GFUD01039965.1.p1 GENE.GFUD01039965.1~~GFUD01039965.1.p1  ORF type:complete len:346 (-),score=108.89 GFUD01039965.1:17-1054(-)
MSYGAVEGGSRRSSEVLESNIQTPLLESSSETFTSSSPDVKIDIPLTQEQELIFPNEPVKTALSFLFLIFGFLVTTFSLALTHDRVPDYNPLPDIVLDNTTYHQWGLKASEIIIIISIVLAFFTVIVHTHRMIIIRRVFLILGLLYMYRGLTMFVTVLPISDKNYECAPKLNHSITFLELISRVVTIVSGGGLSMNGKQIYCGDFIFSGHTMVLMMAFFVVREYSPRTNRFLVFHLLSFVLSVTGVAMLLVSRGHYSIDCLVAYWVTSRVWWTYHTMASNHNLKLSGSHNHMDNIWWWCVFRHAEANVPDMVPRRYSLPLSRGVREGVSKIIRKLGVRWERGTIS